MPNYIDVFTKKGNHFSGVREHESVDIDYVYRYFKEKAQQKYTLLGTQIR